MTTAVFAEVPASPVDAYQNLVEFGALWDHVAAQPHDCVVEIGSLFGGTLHYWSHLPSIVELVSVDLPSDWKPVAAGVRKARGSWHAWMGGRVRFSMFSADSHDYATVERVQKTLDGELIDFLFIDGDHSYEGVRADWLAWSPLVRPGGLVAFHDTWPGSTVNVEAGVAKWVDELRHHLPSITWTDPDGVGIAAFRMPS